MTYHDGIARFRAYFDSTCENCFAEIMQDEDMAFDKVEQQYICDNCADSRSYDRVGDEHE